MRRSTFLLVVSVGAAFPPRFAAAQDPAAFEEARRTFERGVELLDQGDAASAIESFERSLALRQSLSALYNLGLAYRKAARPKDALLAFERFLDRSLAEGHSNGVEHAKLLAEELRGTVGRIALTVEGGAEEVRADGRTIGDRDGLYGLVLDPGEHVVEARRAERLETLAVHLDPGASVEVRLRVASEPALAVVPPPVRILPPVEPLPAPEPLIEKWWFWTIIGVVAAGAAAGIIVAARPSDPEYDGGTNGVLLRALETR
jgi:hypothetical protein